MEQFANGAGPAYLLTITLMSVVALLVLIVRLRVHAFVALCLVSLLVALGAGVTLEQVVPTLLSGFGATLASVALLVGLGAMIGKILEVSGGATVLADTLIGRFGSDRAPFALGVASLLFGFPIFFDAGLIVMMPVIFSVARRFGEPILIYALPAAGAFAAMHALVPPHPGPVAAAELLGADVGRLLVAGIVTVIPAWYLGGYLFGILVGRRFRIDPGPEGLFQFEPASGIRPPQFSLVFFILLLPLLLIFLDTGSRTLVSGGFIEDGSMLLQVLGMLGKTPIALLITLLFCLVAFSRTLGMAGLEKLCGDALAPVCGVILITGAGGMYGGVLRAGGVGEALTGQLAHTGLPVIAAAFVIAACLRVAQGSATVALTTAAALMAPVVEASGLGAWDVCFVVIAIAGGATVLSHFNDSGFWLVSRLLNLDAATTLRTWTVMVTLLGSISFVIACLFSFLIPDGSVSS